MKTPAVMAWCQGLWDARAAGRLRPAGDLGRELSAAVAADVAAHRRYDPECDQRVLWAREVVAALRGGAREPRADGGREAWAAWLLDREPARAGRELACADH